MQPVHGLAAAIDHEQRLLLRRQRLQLGREQGTLRDVVYLPNPL